MYMLVKSRQGKLILQNNPDRKQKSNNVFEISKQKTTKECIYVRDKAENHQRMYLCT